MGHSKGGGKGERAENKAHYWAGQAGLLTPLTFNRHRSSPLAVSTSGATFFTIEGGDSEFAKFAVPHFLKHFKGP